MKVLRKAFETFIHSFIHSFILSSFLSFLIDAPKLLKTSRRIVKSMQKLESDRARVKDDPSSRSDFQSFVQKVDFIPLVRRFDSKFCQRDEDLPFKASSERFSFQPTFEIFASFTSFSKKIRLSELCQEMYVPCELRQVKKILAGPVV